MILSDIVFWLENFFANQYILMGTTSILMVLRVYLLIRFAIFSLSGAQTQKARFFLVLTLTSATFVDSLWIIKVLRDTFCPISDYRPYRFWLRLTWGVLVVQYHSLALFLESLVSPIKFFSKRQLPFLVISGGFIAFALLLGILNFNCFN